MANYILHPIVELRAFIIATVLAALAVFALAAMIAMRPKKGIGSFGIQAVFVGRTPLQLVSLGLGILELTFIVSSIIVPVGVGEVQIMALASMCLVRGLLILTVENFVSELMFGGMGLAALTAGSLLLDFMRETGFDLYIALIWLFLSLFLFLYTCYHFVKSVERVLRQNEKGRIKKYSKKEK